MKRGIHLSVDDTINIFQDLTTNSNNYNSIFENSILKEIKTLHDKYDLKISFYCFTENGDKSFKLEDCTLKFKKEFAKNRNWLSFGYHSLNGKTNPSEMSLKDFINNYKYFNKNIKKIIGSKPSKIIRLHNYIATEEIHEYLFKKGIKYLLVSKEMKTNKHMENTHIRIEKCDDIIKELNNLNEVIDIINIFTHEWMFYDDCCGTIKKIEDCCKWKEENSYIFYN